VYPDADLTLVKGARLILGSLLTTFEVISTLLGSLDNEKMDLRLKPNY